MTDPSGTAGAENEYEGEYEEEEEEEISELGKQEHWEVNFSPHTARSSGGSRMFPTYIDGQHTSERSSARMRPAVQSAYTRELGRFRESGGEDVGEVWFGEDTQVRAQYRFKLARLQERFRAACRSASATCSAQASSLARLGPRVSAFLAALDMLYAAAASAPAASCAEAMPRHHQGRPERSLTL